MNEKSGAKEIAVGRMRFSVRPATHEGDYYIEITAPGMMNSAQEAMKIARWLAAAVDSEFFEAAKEIATWGRHGATCDAYVCHRDRAGRLVPTMEDGQQKFDPEACSCGLRTLKEAIARVREASK